MTVDGYTRATTALTLTVPLNENVASVPAIISIETLVGASPPDQGQL